MTAREMFEELGYKYQENYFDENIDEIKYIKANKFASSIVFKLDSKCFKIFRYNDEYKSGWCDINMLQAINQQVKELGWDD